MEFELAYYDSAVHRFNHYTTRTLPKLVLCQDDYEELLKAFPRSPEVEAYHQIPFSVIPRTPLFWGGLTPLERDTVSIFKAVECTVFTRWINKMEEGKNRLKSNTIQRFYCYLSQIPNSFWQEFRECFWFVDLSED